MGKNLIHSFIPAFRGSPRITSYNVCYTKLLRDRVLALGLGAALWLEIRQLLVQVLWELPRELGILGLRAVAVCHVAGHAHLRSDRLTLGGVLRRCVAGEDDGQKGVITSYSIHYTKLYDEDSGFFAFPFGTILGGDFLAFIDHSFVDLSPNLFHIIDCP